MTCGSVDPVIPKNKGGKMNICLRPDSHTGCHKGRWRIWTAGDHPHTSRYTTKQRAVQIAKWPDG